MILPLALSASLPVVTGGEFFFSPPREFYEGASYISSDSSGQGGER